MGVVFSYRQGLLVGEGEQGAGAGAPPQHGWASLLSCRTCCSACRRDCASAWAFHIRSHPWPQKLRSEEKQGRARLRELQDQIGRLDTESQVHPVIFE